jgi:ADP-heptose:LPS heptosyltransferase
VGDTLRGAVPDRRALDVLNTMPGSLQIYDPRERILVTAADLALAPLRLVSRTAVPSTVRRVLLLRLERIGDLLMTLEAISLARATWPDAEIDLVVGEWNTPIASLLQDVTRIEILNAPWLARGGHSDTWPAMMAVARGWRARRYDVAVNFEPDIRSNFLLWWSGAPLRAGYGTGGGGAFLTSRAAYDPTVHVSENARALVGRAGGLTGAVAPRAKGEAAPSPRLRVPREARARLAVRLAAARRPLVGIHASGGRESKQWHIDRFADVARRLATERAGTVVLTGGPGDAALVRQLEARLSGVPGINAAGSTDLVDLAALLEALDVLVTGDTGPMHLAAAVGAPVVALFGPSDPARYGPRAPYEKILFASSVPCRPCGQVRLPPVRCRGHVPDCMDGIRVEDVVSAALELMDRRSRTDHPVPA